MRSLDKHEGYPAIYNRVNKKAITEDGYYVEAITYIMREQFRRIATFTGICGGYSASSENRTYYRHFTMKNPKSAWYQYSGIGLQGSYVVVNQRLRTSSNLEFGSKLIAP